ncbi:MAG: hypothetical protein NZO16_00140 [Deltaproteobacteria bacterium]|nr:hypothetical protein [Deltaproteobacteria bacterium]
MQRLKSIFVNSLRNLSKRELYLVLILVGFVLLVLLTEIISKVSAFYTSVRNDSRELRQLIDTFLVLKSKKTGLESMKKSLEDSYLNFVWNSNDIGELTKFEEVKSMVAREGTQIDQFRVEPLSSEKFSDDLTKQIFRVNFNSSSLLGVIQYLNQFIVGDLKALPLRVKIDKKTSNDGLVVSIDFLLLRRNS